MTSCHIPPGGFRGVYRDDEIARALYSEAVGIGRMVPAAVAVPVDAEDAQTVVRWASEKSLAVIPRGSGTSMAGGAIGSGVIVDLSRMNWIGEIDTASRSVWVGPGALRGDVNRKAGEHGLRFPVDPSSGEFCTIGGMVSTNAAGARTLRYGATREWVLALDCIFDGGERAILRRQKDPGDDLAPPSGSGTEGVNDLPALRRFAKIRDRIAAGGGATCAHPGVAKESSGYGIAEFARSGDLVDLIAGSEGTLAVVVGIKLALAELPAATRGVLAAFDSVESAAAAAVGARATGAAACELLDRTFLEFASRVPPGERLAALAALPNGTDAVLLAEAEGGSADEAGTGAEKLSDHFRSAGATMVWTATDAESEKAIWDLRHAASPIIARLDPSLRSMQFIEDGAVPAEHFAEYVRGVRAAFDAHGVRGVIFGHAGDAHAHVNPLIDIGEPDWRRKVEGLLEDVVSLTGKLGGTLAAEHGDGRLRTPLMQRVWSEEARALFAAVKNAFDPRGILNPGVKVPLPDQVPVGDVKYDPSLPPLPPAVREALDRMSADRAYATLRLTLVP